MNLVIVVTSFSFLLFQDDKDEGR